MEILNNGTVSGRNSMTFVVMVVFVCGITETYARVHVCSCGCLPLRAPAVLKHNISVGKIPWLKINLSFDLSPVLPNQVIEQEVQGVAGKEHCSGIFVKLAEVSAARY